MTEHLQQLLRFALVGALGFVVDAGVVQLLVSLAEMNPYGGRAISFVCAASFTWLLNRSFTFRAQGQASHREWGTYLACMLAGGALNWLTFAAVLESFPATASWPWIGVAAGSLAGMLANFGLAKWLVFRHPRPPLNHS